MLRDYQDPKRDRTKTTLENLKAGFEKFNEENGHYPSSKEIGRYKYLPAVKLIDRRFGGLRKFRELLGIEITDQRTGDTRSNVARKINEAAYYSECKMGRLLVEKFGKMYVHVQAPITTTSNKRSDFLIYHKTGKFFVDIFCPADRFSFFGCVNFKMKKYIVNAKDTIYLVNTNKHIDCDVSSKKNMIPDNQRVVSLKDFEHIISQFEPFVV